MSKTDPEPRLLRHSRPPRFPDDAVQALSAPFKRLLADMFALYIKTKNFHWHVSGPHFRDYHLLLDDQILATTDVVAERVRKVGGTTIRSIAHIARCQRVRDNDKDNVRPADMLEELPAAPCSASVNGKVRRNEYPLVAQDV